MPKRSRTWRRGLSLLAGSAILGHAWSKTTLIYAGSSSRRASQAYNQYLLKQREALKLLRSKKMKRKPTCEL